MLEDEKISSLNPTRRNFLYVATGATAAVGGVALALPLIRQMAPDVSTIASEPIEVDLSEIEPGQEIMVKWKNKPFIIRNRTEEEIKAAKAVKISELRDPFAGNKNLVSDKAKATDMNRSGGAGKENWIVLSGKCTRLGCLVIGGEGDYGGWFCPCGAAHYDTAGRIRKGVAPRNLLIPSYRFVSDEIIKLG